MKTKVVFRFGGGSVVVLNPNDTINTKGTGTYQNPQQGCQKTAPPLPPLALVAASPPPPQTVGIPPPITTVRKILPPKPLYTEFRPPPVNLPSTNRPLFSPNPVAGAATNTHTFTAAATNHPARFLPSVLPHQRSQQPHEEQGTTSLTKVEGDDGEFDCPGGRWRRRRWQRRCWQRRWLLFWQTNSNKSQSNSKNMKEKNIADRWHNCPCRSKIRKQEHHKSRARKSQEHKQ